MPHVYELNLDGLVGPTHHYAGLSYGNVASMTHAHEISNPQKAALQGLEKMRLLHMLGIKQAVLPPQCRPNLAFLHALGFKGSLESQLARAYQENPQALSAAFSASSMWAANAATVTGEIDTIDKCVHFTPANLMRHLHRHQEADATACLLQRIFSNEKYFSHHPVLPKTPAYNDEGAANHNRLAPSHSEKGLYVFVYNEATKTKRFPARQTQAASMAVARQHGLNENQVIFAAQHPQAIDAGVFHNDVIALANASVFLLHEEAFANQVDCLKQLQRKAVFPLQLIEVSKKQLSLKQAVKSYFFNSQLITLPNSKQMALIAPMECREDAQVEAVIQTLIEDTKNPIDTVHFVEVKQSMQNGGGPACLRLRVPLTDNALQAMHQGVLLTDNLFEQLEACIKKHYRTTLSLKDLKDANFAHEAFTAYEAIMALLDLN